MQSPAFEDALHLPPEGASVPRARRYVRKRLEGVVEPDVLDTAELCVSELATNSVLHASTDFEVRVEPRESGARVLVSDRSVTPPRQVPYGPAAATGRGLDLVAQLSREWGVELGDDGKTVWCDVVADGGQHLDDDQLLAAWTDLLDDDPPADGTAAPPPAGQSLPRDVVSLLGYPVRRGLRAREYSDALLRECMLLREAPTGASPVPARLADLADLLSSRYSAELRGPEEAKLEAFRRGDARVDLHYPNVPGAAALVAEWQRALAEMDAYCRAEQLLTLAAPPEVVELRAWELEEFRRQLAGEPPRPWPGPLD